MRVQMRRNKYDSNTYTDLIKFALERNGTIESVDISNFAIGRNLLFKEREIIKGEKITSILAELLNSEFITYKTNLTDQFTRAFDVMLEKPHAKQLEDVYVNIIVTLKGVKFLNEHEETVANKKNSNTNRISIYALVGLAVASFALDLIRGEKFVNNHTQKYECCDKTKHMKHKSHDSLESIILNDVSIKLDSCTKK